MLVLVVVTDFNIFISYLRHNTTLRNTLQRARIEPSTKGSISYLILSLKIPLLYGIT